MTNSFHVERLFQDESTNNYLGKRHGITANSFNNFTYTLVESMIRHYRSHTSDRVIRIFEVGPGWGGLSRIIQKNYTNIIYSCVESDPVMNSVCSLFVDKAFEIDASLMFQHDQIVSCIQSADILILSDVLEHIYDPWLVLFNLFGDMKSGASLVLSVPTITNLASLSYMLETGFAYKNSGIYDFTHLRFFSPDDVIDMVNSSTSRKLDLKIIPNICPDSCQMLQKSIADSTFCFKGEAKGLSFNIKQDSKIYQTLATRGIVLCATT